MKKIIAISAAILMTASVFAQAPNKMSYQAVIRNATNSLVTNQTVGMRISILQSSANGTAVYVETQTPTTNINGLATIEIGGGTVVSGNFSTIDWSAGPYFIKTETDPTGSTSYTITGTSQLLSVPYALHSKTAESIIGTITETDPVFSSSVASGITGSDTTYWNNKLDIAPGTVLQMVVKTSNSTSSLNVTNFTEADQDYRISITPKGINSVFIIEYYFSINTQLSPNTVFHLQLIRDIGGTEVPVGVGPVNGLRNQTTYVSRPNNGTDLNDQQNVYLIAKDSNLAVNTTYTYGFKYRRETGGSGTTYFNYSNDDSPIYGFSGTMTMKITEIAQ